ncbi:aminotransferase class I/II-fold pyridoxal phosphate-dependent enzyme [Leucobacter soli]|uniref:aminotransferase class I/II-fold pyridoxal phosphate-dependent enzyme n=1 Tax=Leucobacter soli TaxID=2812850 RepID=UPI003616C94A
MLPTPVYPGFYEMLEELPFEIVEIPLLSSHADADAGTSTGGGTDADADDGAHQLDLAEIRREFASDRGVDAFLLCNPHNPHGVPFSRESLAELARLAAEHDVFVLSDEIHAPLTWAGQTFTPFAPLAAEVGALSATATSASKGWNLAGAKCSVLIAADDRANSLLQGFP